MKRNANEFEIIAKEMQLEIDAVTLYFNQYDMLKRYPIRDLTYTELSFAKALERLQTKTNGQIQILLADYAISLPDYQKDMSLLPRAMAHFNDDKSFKLLMKYQDILLQPYLLYGNATASMLSIIDKQGLALLLTNLAAGVPMNPTEQISASDRLAATQKIIDILDTKRTFNEKMIADEKKVATDTGNDLRAILSKTPLSELKTIRKVIQEQPAAAAEIVAKAKPELLTADAAQAKPKRKYVRHKPTKAMLLAAAAEQAKGTGVQ